METQTSVAIPEEGDSLKVISSTQWPSLMQNLVSRVIGVNSSKITGISSSLRSGPLYVTAMVSILQLKRGVWGVVLEAK